MIRFGKAVFLIILILSIPTCTQVNKGSNYGPKFIAPDLLKDILPVAIKQFEVENGVKISASYFAPDSILPRVLADSSIDLFVAVGAELLEQRNVRKVLHNYSCPFRLSLVVAARADDSNVRRLLKEGEIRQLANDYFRRVAVIAPKNNYEGRLAKHILEKYRLWKKLQPRLIMARDREQLINYLETGEAVAAIVLESTLNGHDDLRGFLRLDNKLQEYLQICGAVTAYSKKKEMAQAFMDLFDSRLCDIYKTRGIYQN